MENAIDDFLSRVCLYLEHIDWRDEARLITTATLLTCIMLVPQFLLEKMLIIC
jgi:hypothetical protein